MRRTIFCSTAMATLLAVAQFASAQMVTMQSPLQHNGFSFYEQSHIGWSLHNPHYFMNFNGGGGAPPFGGYQPNAGLQGGFAVNNANFNFGFAQGASLNSTSATPVLTTTNGFPGYMFMGSERPFVTGVSPVVGGGFASVPPMSPLTARMATGQLRTEGGRIVNQQPDAVADVRAPQRDPAPAPRPSESSATSRELSASQHLERGQQAEKEGRVGVAKIYYQLAATKGDAVIKAQATQKLDALKAASK